MFRVKFGSTIDDNSEITRIFKIKDLNKELGFLNGNYKEKPAIEVIKHYISKKRLDECTDYENINVFDVRDFEFINKTKLGSIGVQLFREAVS